MKYLTQILDSRVSQPGGEPVGKVIDVVASLGGRLPAISAVVVRSHGRESVIPFEHLDFAGASTAEESGRSRRELRLNAALENIAAYVVAPSDLRLRADVLDKQVVDTGDYRVVRANDVRLIEYGATYCVVGVDASLRALLRRFGAVSRPLEALARLFHRRLRSSLISWDDVQTLEPGTEGGRIRLKVSHDKLARLHPADIADIVEQLSPQRRTEVIGSLDTETAADAIAEAEPEIGAQIIAQLDNETATDILEEMEPDEAADILDDLPDARSEELLEQMEPEEAEDVKELLAYDEDTAGGMMTTEFVSILGNLTCEQTINRLRELAPKAETVYYVYVVDEMERLLGVLSLRDLIIAQPETHVSAITEASVIKVFVEDHADEVAQILGRYNLLAVPVVNEDERLVGLITVDDTLERLLPPERRRRLPVPALAESDVE